MLEVAGIFSLTSLPEDVYTAVLKSWLRLDDIGKLDTAMCCHVLRPHFQQALASVAEVFDIHESRNVSLVFNLLEWLRERCLSVHQWKASVRYHNITHNVAPYAAQFNSILELTCSDVGGNWFYSLLPHCSNLQVLNMTHQVLPNNILPRLTAHCPRLRRVGWNGTGISRGKYQRQPVKQFISSCPSIQEFVMINVDFKHECVKFCIAQNKKVFALGQPGMSIPDIFLTPPLSNAVSTFSLSVQLTSSVIEDGLHSGSLRIAGAGGVCAGFSPTECSAILADHMHSSGLLYGLQMSTCVGMEQLLNSSILLTAIQLSDCRDLTTCTLSALLEAPYLENLSLTDNHTLKTLLPDTYSRNRHYSDESKIYKLELSSFSAVTVQSVAHFVSFCPRLRILKCTSMPHIDNNEVTKICKMFRRNQLLSKPQCSDLNCI